MAGHDDITHYAFFKRLCALPFIDAIYLYGSRARGDNDDWSDVDLAISCPNASASDWNKVLEIAKDADILVDVECTRLDTVANPVFSDQIHKYKRELWHAG